jgi:hypothetical protein
VIATRATDDALTAIRRGHTGRSVRLISAQARGCVVTIVLMVVVAMAIIAGLIWVMMRMERSHRQLIERQREAWRAGGSVGPEPGRGGCSGSGIGGMNIGA